jgi:hypothetical protein
MIEKSIAAQEYAELLQATLVFRTNKTVDSELKKWQPEPGWETRQRRLKENKTVHYLKYIKQSLSVFQGPVLNLVGLRVSRRNL